MSSPSCRRDFNELAESTQHPAATPDLLGAARSQAEAMLLEVDQLLPEPEYDQDNVNPATELQGSLNPIAG